MWRIDGKKLFYLVLAIITVIWAGAFAFKNVYAEFNDKSASGPYESCLLTCSELGEDHQAGCIASCKYVLPKPPPVTPPKEPEPDPEKEAIIKALQQSAEATQKLLSRVESMEEQMDTFQNMYDPEYAHKPSKAPQKKPNPAKPPTDG
jgi:hypothetical protein